jgi:hypothetical protein
VKLTKKQKGREQVAAMLEKLFPKNQSSKELRAVNRKVDKRKGKTSAK